MVVNVASGIALIGVPFYASYATIKAGLARFGEARTYIITTRPMLTGELLKYWNGFLSAMS